MFQRVFSFMSTSSEEKTEVDESAPDVKILELSLKGDYVTIINNETSAVDISNWEIRSLVGNQQFRFPIHLNIAAGSTVTVWSAAEADVRKHEPLSFFWSKKNLWNDKGDTAELRNQNAKLVDRVQALPLKYTAGLAIQKLDAEKGLISIINTTTEDKNLNGYCIKRATSPSTFTFEDYTIQGGTTVTVWTKPKNGMKKGVANVLTWFTSLKETGEAIALYDNDGKLVSHTDSFPSVLTAPTKKQKMEVEGVSESESESEIVSKKRKTSEPATKKEKEKPVTPEKKGPMTAEQFMKLAKPIQVTIEDEEYTAVPQIFSTGSYGYSLTGKVVKVDVNGKQVSAQLSLNMPVRGSKSL